MFEQLKMFVELTQTHKGKFFDMTEPELCIALRLRACCSREDWSSAAALQYKARHVAESKSQNPWIPEEVAQIYLDLGMAFHSLEKPAKALEMCTKAMGIARKFGYKEVDGMSSAYIGLAYVCMGKQDMCIEPFEQALALGTPRWIALYANLADAHLARGNLARAIELYNEVCACAQKLGDRESELAAYESIGSAYNRMKEYATAIATLEPAVSLARELDDAKGGSFGIWRMGGPFGITETGGFAETGGEGRRETRILIAMGLSLLMSGQSRASIERFEKALALSEQDDDQAGQLQILSNLGHIYITLGHFEQSITYQHQIIGIAKGLSDLAPLKCAFGLLALAHRALNDHQARIFNSQHMMT